MQMSDVSGRRVARSTLTLMAVQVLVLAAGFLIAMFLTRRLGPSDYGTYAVVVNIVTWAEITVAALLKQATIRLLDEADDWQATIGSIVRVLAAIGLGMTALLVVSAPLFAKWLADPALVGYIRLYAFDVPLFALSSVLRAALLGRRTFGKAGLVTGLGRGGRLALTLALVGSGLGVAGALMAGIGASLMELIASWYFVRPRLLGRSALSRRVLWSYSLPLFARSVGLQLFRRLDLMTVKALEGAAAAGFYGAARSLTMIPSSRLIVSLSQVLLASLPRLMATGRAERARNLMGQALRWVLYLLPFAAVAAGASPEIVELIYGGSYALAAPAVGYLAIGAVGLSVLLISSSMLTASSRPDLSLAVVVPLAPLSLVGSLILVPRLGIAGAAGTVAVLSWLGAGSSMLLVRRICRVRLPFASLLRIALTASIAYSMASAWPASGAWVIAKLLILCAGVVLCFLALGELTRADLEFARSVLRPASENRMG